MKPTKVKHEPESRKSTEEEIRGFFVICGRCNRLYKDIKNLPIKCDCGACLLCEN